MAVVYFDSSAFVKLLVDEEGSDIAATLWDGCDAAVSSRLTYPEVRAALAAARRDNRVSRADLDRAEATWEGLWAATRAIELTEAISDQAGLLAGELALGGADAIHLASALAMRDSDLVIAAWDRRLRDGTQAAGLHVVPYD